MLQPTAIDNLERLLLSGNVAQVRLGLSILQGHPEQIGEVFIPLLLCLELMGEGSESSGAGTAEAAEWVQEKQHWKDAWRAAVSPAEADRLVHAIRVLKWVKADRMLPEGVFEEGLEDFEQVEGMLQPYLVGHSYYSELYKGIATALYAFYDRTTTHKYYNKLITAMPWDMQLKVDYANFLVYTCFGTGLFRDEMGRADAYLQAALAVPPCSQADIYLSLGLLYEDHLEDMQQAKAYYFQSLALDSQVDRAMHQLAGILFKVDGDAVQARAYAQQAVDVMPVMLNYVDRLAWIELKGFNNIAEAERLFKIAVTEDFWDCHHATLTGLGEVYEAKGKYRKAEQYYLKGLALRPESVYKLLKLGDLLHLRLGESGRAREYYGRVLAVEPGNGYVLGMLEEILKQHFGE